MKTFLKILVAIIIVGALCFGIYCILPETSQMYVKGNIQYRTNETAKTQVDRSRKPRFRELRKHSVQDLKDFVRAVHGTMKKRQMVTGWLHSMVQRQQWI